MDHHIRIAQQLPPRLLAFFKKFPPYPLRTLPSTSTPSSSTTSASPSPTLTTASTTSPTDPNASVLTNTTHPKRTPADWYAIRNPFRCWKNHDTGAKIPPAYSLRRQADLFKLAQQHNVLSLMPKSPKHPEVRLQKRIKTGLRVQGTGVGKKVKGKHWERTLHGRLLERQRAMEGMPALIKEWKQRGHGRGWKKWPK